MQAAEDVGFQSVDWEYELAVVEYEKYREYRRVAGVDEKSDVSSDNNSSDLNAWHVHIGAVVQEIFVPRLRSLRFGLRRISVFF